MKNSIFIKNCFQEFKKHWLKFLFLIIISNIFIGIIVIPILKLLANSIMRMGNIAYISYTNLLEIIIKHPFISLCLFLLVLLLVTTVFIQFTFLLLSISAIQNNRGNLKLVIKETIYVFKLLKPKGFLFFLFYFILIWPFSEAIFYTPLLSKVVIPNFILDFIYNNLTLTIILALSYIIISIIGVRLIFSLPFVVLKKLTLRESIKKSFNITKKKYFKYLSKFIIILLITVGITIIANMVLYLLQVFLDDLPNPIPLIGGVINLTLLQFTNQITSTLGTIFLFNIFLQSDYFNEINWKYIKDKSTIPKRTKKPISKIITVTFNIIVVVSLLGSNIYFLNETINKLPLTISHRGVTNKNGVQNTIPALYRTMKYNPDYIEIDILETKDNKFVVMHDENLKTLAGIDKSPHELNLNELKNITISENGYEAKIASFDEYLGHANKNNQKLLIEFKTTKHDSKDILNNFLKQYKDNIIKNNHIFQTLDYELMNEFKIKAPELYINYILPVNFIFPRSEADGYTMEETTLDQSFIGDASRVGKKVYVWTVNSEDKMVQSIYLDVDGIITDNLTDLNKTIESFKKKPTFAERILTYIILLPE